MNKYMYSSTDLNYVEGYSSLLCRFLETRFLIQVYISLNREASLILLYKYIYICLSIVSAHSLSQRPSTHLLIFSFSLAGFIHLSVLSQQLVFLLMDIWNPHYNDQWKYLSSKSPPS